MILSVLLVATAVCLMYRYLSNCYKMFVRDGISGPKPIFIFGNIFEFAKKMSLEIYWELAQKYGKVFGYYEGLTPSVCISDPELIQAILVKKFSQFDGRPKVCPFLFGAENNYLQNLNGTMWKKCRSAASSGLKSSNIRKMYPKLQTVSKLYVCQLETKRSEHPDGFDVDDLNLRYSLVSFTSAVFNIDSKSLFFNDDNIMYQYIQAAHDSASPENPISGLSRVYPILACQLKLLDRKHKRLAMQFFEFILDLLQKEKSKMGFSEEHKNFLQHLLAFRFTEKDHANNNVFLPLTEEEIVGLAAGMIGGGVGPVGSVLNFTIHCLALHPDKQEKLFQEITHVCGTETDIKLDHIQRMEYLDMFINESLRLFPVAPGVARMCSEDCIINGVQFRKGTAVRLMGCLQYRDPAIYPEPQSFEPERFSDQQRKKRHVYSWLPFGNGPRTCVAKRLAWVQIKVAIITLLQIYVVSPSSITQNPLPVALQPFLRPKNGVFVKLIRREQRGQSDLALA